jgi:hypothetical protein
MKKLTLILLILFFCSTATGQSVRGNDFVRLRVFVQGDTSRLPNYIESMRREFAERGMTVELVERGAEYDYNIIIAQESSVSGAAAAVIVLDRTANLVASVVRSGRWSGKGAFNATAKELAKKIAVLKGL